MHGALLPLESKQNSTEKAIQRPKVSQLSVQYALASRYYTLAFHIFPSE